MTIDCESKPTVCVIVLAGGRGRRMREQFGDLPKVMIPVLGRPMVRHIINSVIESKVSEQVIVVAAPESRDAMENELSDTPALLAIQPTPLGTGDAVLAAMDRAKISKTILVLAGDQPLISPSCICNLATTHKESQADITLLTVLLEDFKDRRTAFLDWGRIIRNESGEVVRITEARDASESEYQISEVNPGVYCFSSFFLWDALKTLRPHNAQGEYQLTDLIEHAASSLRKVKAVQAVDPFELLGANDPAQLKILETIAQERRSRRLAKSSGDQECNSSIPTH